MLFLLDAVVKTTKISKALQATRGGPSDGAGTVWSQFGTVASNHGLTLGQYLGCATARVVTILVFVTILVL